MSNDLITKDNALVRVFFERMDETLKRLSHALENRKPTLNGEQFLTNRDVSAKLHISLRTLQEYRDKGLLPHIKLDGKILYRASDIERLLESFYSG